MSEKLKTEKGQGKNGLAFIKEVAKYFMDFLETDFHKRRNPKRSIQLRNSCQGPRFSDTESTTF